MGYYLLINKITREIDRIENADPGDTYPNHWVVEEENVYKYTLRIPATLDLNDRTKVTTSVPGTILENNDILTLRRKALRRKRVAILRNILMLLDADSPITSAQRSTLQMIKTRLLTLDVSDPDKTTLPTLPAFARTFLGED